MMRGSDPEAVAVGAELDGSVFGCVVDLCFLFFQGFDNVGVRVAVLTVGTDADEDDLG